MTDWGARVIPSARARLCRSHVGERGYEFEAIWQTGEISASAAPTAMTQRVCATFVHADIGYTSAGPFKPHLSVEFDRASGDRRGGGYGRPAR